MKQMIRLCLLALSALLLSVQGQAQDVVGGALSSQVVFGQIGGYTVLNLDTPFNADGNINTLTARFSYFSGATACAAGDTFKVRVFRPNTGNGYSMVAERGPFNDAAGYVTVPLSPAIAVKRGDVVGIALYGPGQCGLTGYYGTQNHLVQMNGDYTSGAPSYQVDVPGSTMNFRAASAAAAYVGTLPGAGVTNGAGGSSFNTSLSVTNPSAAQVTLTFAYRAVGASPETAPITATLDVPSSSTKSPKLTDLMSVSGVGSIDVYSTGATPIVNARVYNDTGSGTNGFTEPLVAPNAAAHEFDRLWLTIPSDLSAYRMNVGVRTFASGATMNCIVWSSTGSAAIGLTKTYAANATSLESLQSFFGGDNRAIQPGGSIQCTMATDVKTDVVLYGTVTDNRTNDSAMYLAEKH